jgi:hypothetical protein
MDNQHLRAIIIELQDRLSDDDRKRLHFFLGNDIPRGIEDNPTLGGTLSLIQYLFDQDKINERDVSFLIRAFTIIKCFPAVALLTGKSLFSVCVIIIKFVNRTPETNKARLVQ